MATVDDVIPLHFPVNDPRTGRSIRSFRIQKGQVRSCVLMPDIQLHKTYSNIVFFLNLANYNDPRHFSFTHRPFLARNHSGAMMRMISSHIDGSPLKIKMSEEMVLLVHFPTSAVFRKGGLGLSHSQRGREDVLENGLVCRMAAFFTPSASTRFSHPAGRRLPSYLRVEGYPLQAYQGTRVSA